jgi:DNA mismatch repair ATPase MutL
MRQRVFGSLVALGLAAGTLSAEPRKVEGWNVGYEVPAGRRSGQRSGAVEVLVADDGSVLTIACGVDAGADDALRNLGQFLSSLQVTAVPDLFDKTADIREMIERILERFLSPSAAKAQTRYDGAALMACKASVKAHDPLDEREALQLAADLALCRDMSCCPHGRPTFLSLDRDELARRFGRSGPP